MKPRLLNTLLFLCALIVISSVLVGWKNKSGQYESNEIRKAVDKSFLLLERSGYLFTERSALKCAGCHHTTMTAMVAGLAREKGVQVIDSFSRHRIEAMEHNLRMAGNPNLVDQFLPVNFNAPYVLVGLYAEKSPPNVYTDISVDYTISQARSDGSFLAESGRVPLQTGDIHCTAFSIRAIQLYASPAKKIKVDSLLAKTKYWIEIQKPDQQQELVFQLLGMQWCGSSHELKAQVAQKLYSIQHSDGGWSQLNTMASDAYSTGQTLYALIESGMIKSDDDIYQKGIGYLLKSQDPTGAWIIRTRSYGIQPFFTSDFPPYDENQFISAAATNWADLALLEALPNK